MDNSIIVSVSDLRSRIQDIRRSGMDFVELSIQPSEIDDGEFIPASLDFSASKSIDTSMWVDFEPIDALENEQKLKEISLTAIHMSDNLM
jgi:hypothetical protein